MNRMININHEINEKHFYSLMDCREDIVFKYPSGYLYYTCKGRFFIVEYSPSCGKVFIHYNILELADLDIFIPFTQRKLTSRVYFIKFVLREIHDKILNGTDFYC